jgi:hypothetical protein
MDYNSITFGLDVLISIVFGAGGALGVWFKLKGSVNIQAVEIASLNSELKDIKDEYKEDKKSLHKRIDSQKELIEKNRENSDSGINKMTENMNAMELRIIKAIHEIRK